MRHGYFYLNQKWHYLTSFIATYSLASSVFLSIVDVILQRWCPAWSTRLDFEVTGQQAQWGPAKRSCVRALHLLPLRGTTSTTSSPRQAFKRVQSKAAESRRNGRKTRSVRFKRLSRDGGHCHHFLRQWPAERLRVFFFQVWLLTPRGLCCLSALLLKCTRRLMRSEGHLRGSPCPCVPFHRRATPHEAAGTVIVQ